MHRRIWFLVVAAAAVLAVAGSAAATSHRAAAAAPGTVQPFAKAWAQTPRTPAAREAKKTITVAMEQDLAGTWNVNQASSTLAWAVWVENGILRSPYELTNKYQYKYDLVTKVTVNKKFIQYNIRKNANWNYGGKTIPVTYKDFVYTVKALNNPNNDVASNVGVNQIAKFTHKGQKIVTFWWKKNGQPSLGGSKKPADKKCSSTAPCGPFADYRDLLGFLYPSAAVAGLNWNTMWAKCVCGKNGKPVSDGPYLMTNYTKGQGVTLKANPKWYGKKPSITTVNFKLYTNTNSEVQAIRSGEVDAAAPQPTPALSSIRGVKGVNYHVAPGNYLEHIDIQEGPHQTNPLARKSWMRQAIMMGLNRQGLINAVFGQIAPGLHPLNSLLVFQSDSRYKNYFNKWNYNPKGAIALLKKHGCKGGPSKPTNGNTNYFTCGGQLATFPYTTASDNARRVESYTVFKANLAAIGIQLTDNLMPTAVMFGDTVLSAGNYSLMEFAWGGAVDPGGFISIWGCGQGQNFLHYCNKKVTADLNATKTQLNATKRNADFVAADQLMSNDVPAIPLYALPDIITFRSGLKNNVNNPAAGFTWNIEQWKWS
jgi:peptide/nickel transport system substrate-binding protein